MDEIVKTKRPTTKRGILVCVIAFLAFVLAAISAGFAMLDFWQSFKATGGNIKEIDPYVLYPLLVDAVFAVLEISIGIKIIKLWNTEKYVEIHKNVIGLLNVIVYEGFVIIMLDAILAYMHLNSFAAIGVDVFFILAYVVYLIVSSSSSTYVKRNDLVSLFVMLIICALLASLFSGFDFVVALDDSATVDMIVSTLNVLLCMLVIAFAISMLVHYKKNPDELLHDIEVGEDSEVIERTESYEKVKVYQHRANETGVNVFITVLYLLSVATGIAGIVYFAIEHRVWEYCRGTLGEFIDVVYGEIVGGGTEHMMTMIMLFMIVVFYPLIYISAATGAINRDARSKISFMSTTSLGTSLLLCKFITVLTSIVMSISMLQKLDFSSYSILEIGIIIVYIVHSIVTKIINKQVKEAETNIQKGDSYASQIGAICRGATVNGIFSIISFVILFLMELDGGALVLSYVFFALSALLTVVATCLEVKHPFNEYVIVKRKLRKEAKSTEQIEE